MILDFGNITCANTQTLVDDCRVYIEWETVMVDNPATIDGGTYWQSAGAEYNDQNEVWVGQASFTTVPWLNDDTKVSSILIVCGYF